VIAKATTGEATGVRVTIRFVARKWCLSCEQWVDPVLRRIDIGREGGDGMERAPSPIVEACPNDDLTASGHLLADAAPV
jgi:hypothetical protein